MLNLNLPVSSEIISPHEWYYQNTFVQPLWTGDNIILFKATLPLVAVDAWRHLQFQVWPYFLENVILNLTFLQVYYTTQDITPSCWNRPAWSVIH